MTNTQRRRTTTQAKPQGAANKKKRKPRIARVTATGALGNSWMEVYAGSQAGQLLYRGTLEAGQVIRFQRPKLFVVMGRPGNVRIKLNGRVVEVPNRGSPTAVIVTPRGLTPTSASA